MRIRLLVCTLFLLQCGMSTGWHLPQVLLNFLPGRSHIPQFTLDTQHPWLEQNRARLERLDDVQHALCSLNSTLRPSNGSSDTYPINLFKRLQIDNNRAGVTRGGWSNAVARIKEMLSCPAALVDVECFEVVIYVSDGKYNIGVKEDPDPPSELPKLFIELFNSMPNLNTLNWETFGSGNDIFRKAFTDAGLNLPSVKHLLLAEYMECFVSMCPNTEFLESGGSSTTSYWRQGLEGDPRLAFIESARSAKNISRFGMKGEWEIEHFEAVLRVMPNITSLDIDGELGRGGRFLYHSGEPPAEELRALAVVLPRFPRLKNLRLPPSYGLNVGFDGGSPCGNSYFGSSGREYGRSVSEESANAVEKATDILSLALLKLESLSIGGYQANMIVDESGKLNITWPWTGRMKEWTYEEWP